ncbi:alpha-E domain-containing protein [Candidatus Methylacidiphilum infernorum]|uniref:Alpha-E domain-containing protein n=2 Tax=Candidatus Methylacidiphilum infernorum TaxID=511746 RepID=A0ABX7PUY2_9BACT|nr:alpha-E domain-containing protein [Candidatus Methylacidiphilum infernorum]
MMMKTNGERQRLENVYWMARYAERALLTLNVAQNYLGYGLEASEENWSSCWERIKKGLRISRCPADFSGKIACCFFFLVFDPDNSLSAFSSLFSARENAKLLRDWLPLALWEELNSAYFLISSTTASSSNLPSSLYPFLRNILERLLLIRQWEDYLLEEDCLWAWLKIGESLEKVGNSAAFFFAYHPADNKDPLPFEEWEAFLSSLFLLDLIKKKIPLHELSFEKIASYMFELSLYSYSFPSQLNKILHYMELLSGQWAMETAQAKTNELLTKVLERAKEGFEAESTKKLFLDIQIECNQIHQYLLSALA